jgi:hypothetical protein
VPQIEVLSWLGEEVGEPIDTKDALFDLLGGDVLDAGPF